MLPSQAEGRGGEIRRDPTWVWPGAWERSEIISLGFPICCSGRGLGGRNLWLDPGSPAERREPGSGLQIKGQTKKSPVRPFPCLSLCPPTNSPLSRLLRALPVFLQARAGRAARSSPCPSGLLTHEAGNYCLFLTMHPGSPPRLIPRVRPCPFYK